MVDILLHERKKPIEWDKEPWTNYKEHNESLLEPKDMIWLKTELDKLVKTDVSIKDLSTKESKEEDKVVNNIEEKREEELNNVSDELNKKEQKSKEQLDARIKKWMVKKKLGNKFKINDILVF